MLTTGKGRQVCFASGILLLLCASCRSLPPLPPADLSAPGWRVQHGQAVWKPNGHRPELAGELLIATHTNGNYVIEFTKSPFAIVSGYQNADSWRIDFGNGQRTWQGRGHGPRLLSWFELPHVLAGEQPGRAWHFTQTNTTWRLESWRNGEWLEGTFPP